MTKGFCRNWTLYSSKHVIKMYRLRINTKTWSVKDINHRKWKSYNFDTFFFLFRFSFLSLWWLIRLLVLPLCLGILSVLSLSSECTSLASELPKVSYVKAIDIWLIACLLFGFASLVEYAVVQVMLNSPKRIEAEKAKIASKEKAAGKNPAARNNTVNGTGGTPLHVSTLHVSASGLITWLCLCVCYHSRMTGVTAYPYSNQTW